MKVKSKVKAGNGGTENTTVTSTEPGGETESTTFHYNTIKWTF